jgi:hypothetical protein
MGPAQWRRHFPSIRIIMNFKSPFISVPSNAPSAFRKLRHLVYRPAPTGVLPVQDLRRIVAEMLG